MEKPEVFYMVYVEGGKSPSVKHTSRRSALKEAFRLTEQTKMPAYILRAVGMTYAIEVTKPTYEIKGISLANDD